MTLLAARDPVAVDAAAVRTGRVPGERVVPWSTVLPLAVVLSFTNGFVVIAIRGSIGSIDRTKGPFLAWLLESTLLVPLFAFVVMAVLVRVRRRYGPHPQRGRAVAGAGLRIAGAGAGTGVLVLAANAWLDQHLQVESIEHMGSMGTTCFSRCIERLNAANLELQVLGVAWGAVLLLVTNLLVVGWLLALRGGRLRLDPGGHEAGLRPSPAHDARLLLALGLLGAGLVHAAVVADHLEVWWVEGAFFVALAVAQVATAALVLTTSHRAALLLAIVVSAGPLLLWLVSRTVGIPVGPEPWVPEGVGLADGATALLEQAVLLLALVRLRGTTSLQRYHATAAGWRLAVVGVVALTTLGLGSGFAVLGAGHDHDDDQPTFDRTSVRESHPRPPGPA